jgi:hypothetical protein
VLSANQKSIARLFTRQGGIPQGHWCYPRLATKMLARRKFQSGPKFEDLILKYVEIDAL